VTAKDGQGYAAGRDRNIRNWAVCRRINRSGKWLSGAREQDREDQNASLHAALCRNRIARRVAEATFGPRWRF